MRKRHIHLDQLRGIAALIVLLFHVDKWSAGVWSPGTVLGKSGVYAVSAFFVLSGLTLGLVYAKTPLGEMRSARFWKKFAVKRAFRILPLLGIATVSFLTLDGMGQWRWTDVALNFSGLFGLFSPGRDIALGAWSIGVEVFCYLLFPALIYCLRMPRQWVFWMTVAASIAAGGWYAFERLRPDMAFVDQYGVYVEVLNHFYFFVLGVGAARYVSVLPSTFWRWVLPASMLFYVAWPVAGEEPSALLCGWTRVALSAATLLIVAGWHGSGWALPGGVFAWLGQISYSVYLLHPLVYRIEQALLLRFLKTGMPFLPVLTIFATLAVAHMVYRYFEKPLMEIGKRLDV